MRAGEDWPVGLRNPLLPHERLGTLMFCDQALSTSGSNVQYFRHAGERYGHILDPRTGWPPSHLLSVSVVAPTAAVADALSTAFFVAGVETRCAIAIITRRLGRFSFVRRSGDAP